LFEVITEMRVSRKLNFIQKKVTAWNKQATVQEGEYGVEDPGRHITGNYMHIIIK